MTSKPDKLEHKLASLIRLLLSNHASEVDGAAHALIRVISGAEPEKIHALADRIEKPNGHDLTEAEMRKIYDTGYRAGVQAAESKLHGANDFIGADGKPTWEAVALFLQRNRDRLDPKHYEFIDDMAARTAWGQEPTERQHKYLHSLFFKLGGRITS
jgi:hypothetical protein